MAFVNEDIPSDDFKNYKIKKIQTRLGGGSSTQWTINRERNIFLHRLHGGGREPERSHIAEWIFFWKSQVFILEIHLLDTKGARNAPTWSHKEVHSIQIYDDSQTQRWRKSLPENLKASCDELFFDLEEALLAYKSRGIYSTCTDYTLQLDIKLIGT